MTLQDWTPLYSRLCAGVGRKESPAQLRAYYDAMHTFPVFVVTEAVVIACSRTWPPTHPHAGDLREIAVGIRRAKTVSAKTCDVCNGSTWTVHKCTPETPCGADHPAIERVPIYSPNPAHARWIERPMMHEYAKRCWQCWQPMEPAA